jgi:acetyltransferase-like isoleucine patch superfamily enzyme
MSEIVPSRGVRLRSWVKAMANGLALALVAPFAATCWIEAKAGPAHEGVFCFWAHLFSFLPGNPGMILRRAFYRLALDRCSAHCFVGFGALFSHRQVLVEDGVYVGPYALIGSARLRTGCLIGSRASLLSGSELHVQDADGQWAPFDPARMQQIEIGEHTWIGEGSIVMADVGASSAIAAGTVVTTAVPPGVVMAGNPARFVRRLTPVAEREDEAGIAIRASGVR